MIRTLAIVALAIMLCAVVLILIAATFAHAVRGDVAASIESFAFALGIMGINFALSNAI